MDSSQKASRRTVRRWIVRGLVVVAVVALGAIALAPEPPKVAVVAVRRGAMRVELDGEGRTRVRDRFTISAPISGELERVTLRVGDSVSRGAVVARMRAPARDPAQLEELARRIESAGQVWRTALDVERQARIALDAARREQSRVATVVATGAVARQEAELADDRVALATTELAAAGHRAAAAEAEIAALRASLVSSGSGGTREIALRAPASGRIMSVVEQSRRTLPAGTPIVVLGDPRRSEVVVDLLSSDAVRVSPGARMTIEGWGGGRELAARVRSVDPVGVTRLSALGIEEQRVDVIADLIDHDARLGDGYRVEARIVVWERADVLSVPTSALFRHHGAWSLFVVRNGRAVRQAVRVGERNPFECQIVSGLRAGEKVIPFPSDKLEEGMEVEVAGDESF